MWLILIIFAIWRAINIWKNWKFIKLSWELKIDTFYLPFIGHAYIFIGTDEDQMKAFQYIGLQALKHNGITSSWIGDQLAIVVADPVLGEIFTKQFLEKGHIAYKCLQPALGNGSLMSPVSIWRPRRKILVPIFHPKYLKNFVEIFDRQSNIMVELLKSKVNTGPFPVWDYLTTYTMDAIYETTFGCNLNAQYNHDHQFLKDFELASQLIGTRMVSPWQHNYFVYKLTAAYRSLRKATASMSNTVENMINSTRKKMEELKDNKINNSEIETQRAAMKTFLELLIESSGRTEGYSNLELREETLVLVFAGTDTSAVGSSFVAVMLARHPDVQDKVYKELEEVFGDSKRPVTAEDLPRLTYLEAVIKECLRLYPPVPVSPKQCDRDYTLPSGVTLLKGCLLVVNNWAIHRNQKYWGDDAEEFRPERFLDTPFKHPAQFMPFGYGPRNCLGYQYAMMSMKTAIVTLLRSYRLLPGTPTTPGGQHKPLRLKFNIMMKDVDEFLIQLQDR